MARTLLILLVITPAVNAQLPLIDSQLPDPKFGPIIVQQQNASGWPNSAWGGSPSLYWDEGRAIGELLFDFRLIDGIDLDSALRIDSIDALATRLILFDLPCDEEPAWRKCYTKRFREIPIDPSFENVSVITAVTFDRPLNRLRGTIELPEGFAWRIDFVGGFDGASVLSEPFYIVPEPSGFLLIALSLLCCHRLFRCRARRASRLES